VFFFGRRWTFFSCQQLLFLFENNGPTMGNCFRKRRQEPYTWSQYKGKVGEFQCKKPILYLFAPYDIREIQVNVTLTLSPNVNWGKVLMYPAPTSHDETTGVITWKDLIVQSNGNFHATTSTEVLRTALPWESDCEPCGNIFWSAIRKGRQLQTDEATDFLFVVRPADVARALKMFLTNEGMPSRIAQDCGTFWLEEFGFGEQNVRVSLWKKALYEEAAPLAVEWVGYRPVEEYVVIHRFFFVFSLTNEPASDLEEFFAASVGKDSPAARDSEKLTVYEWGGCVV
jgi:hypothetical protein